MNMLDHARLDRATTIAGVRAVVDGTLVDDARVTIEDGIIVDVSTGTHIGRGALDGGGSFLLPGLVDSHTDGLERECQPRQTARLDTRFALRSYESRLWSAGITTVFHGIGFDDRPGHQRTLESAVELWEAVSERQEQGSAPVDHRILHRLEARTVGGFDALLSCLPAHGRDGPLPLVSFEDHTPGQGQYRDVSRFVEALSDEYLPAGVSREERTRQLLEEAAASRDLVERNRAGVGKLARSGAVTALAHDVEDAAGIEAAYTWGARIAEFPLTVDAARRARELEMPVVCGAPNALRGGSHSGNVSAGELVAAGLCTVLASDYLPTSLLASVWLLARSGVTSLATAVGLVTSGPAAALGLHDRGRIAPGRRADLLLVDDDQPWPLVRAVTTATGRYGRFDERSIA